MKKFTFLLTFSFITISAITQNAGYLGHGFFIGAGGGIIPDIRRLEETNYVLDEMIEPAVNFHIPLSGEFNCVLSKSISIGAGITFTNVKANFEDACVKTRDDSILNYYYSGVNYKASFFRMYIEGHRRFGYSMIDNYFRLGIGKTFFSNTKYYKTYTAVELDDFSHVFTEAELPEEYICFRFGQKSSMTGLYYEFGNRIPVSNHFLIYYGISGYIFPIRNIKHTNFFHPSLHNDNHDTFIINLGKQRVSSGNGFGFNAGLVWAF